MLAIVDKLCLGCHPNYSEAILFIISCFLSNTDITLSLERLTEDWKSLEDVSADHLSEVKNSCVDLYRHMVIVCFMISLPD